MAPKQLNFITGNKNKLTEVKAILGDTVDLQSQALDLVEIQGTIEEISVDKCRRAAAAVSCPPGPKMSFPLSLFSQITDDSLVFLRSTAQFSLKIRAYASML